MQQNIWGSLFKVRKFHDQSLSNSIIEWNKTKQAHACHQQPCHLFCQSKEDIISKKMFSKKSWANWQIRVGMGPSGLWGCLLSDSAVPGTCACPSLQHPRSELSTKPPKLQVWSSRSTYSSILYRLGGTKCYSRFLGEVCIMNIMCHLLSPLMCLPCARTGLRARLHYWTCVPYSPHWWVLLLSHITIKDTKVSEVTYLIQGFVVIKCQRLCY